MTVIVKFLEKNYRPQYYTQFHSLYVGNICFLLIPAFWPRPCSLELHKIGLILIRIMVPHPREKHIMAQREALWLYISLNSFFSFHAHTLLVLYCLLYARSPLNNCAPHQASTPLSCPFLLCFFWLCGPVWAWASKEEASFRPDIISWCSATKR